MINGTSVSCGVVLYNPSNEVVERIKGYAQVFKYVYVFDNSEPQFYSKNLNIQKEIMSIPNSIYIYQNENVGLSIAYNKFLEICKTKYMCIIDQDSQFSKENILSMIEKINLSDKELVIIGPRVIYDKKQIQKEDKMENKDYIISSGSFLNVDYLKELNIRFDENYFIDRVDVDICRQIKNKGYSVCMYYGAVLYQELGELSKNGHRTHSPLRQYYMFRNRFYYNRKFIRNPVKRWCVSLIQTIHQLYYITVNDNQKMRRYKAFIYACMDNKKMGKTSRTI